MPVSTTSRTDGSTVLSSITNTANGARGMGIPCITVRALTNACSVMGQGTRNSYATSHTKDVEWEECAAFPTITQEWPTPTAHQMSGLLDDGKDINKGVMS
jgi:hypothetical protein